MKHLGNLIHAEGATQKKKRVGRGPGSGHGRTATRGNKGAQSRRNYKQKRSFEGGQMPLSRRVPKFGFTNRFRVEYQILNVSRLQELFDAELITGSEVTAEMLRELGILSNKNEPLKILGNGDITASVNIVADSFSETAKQKIESAGGTIKTNG